MGSDIIYNHGTVQNFHDYILSSEPIPVSPPLSTLRLPNFIMSWFMIYSSQILHSTAISIKYDNVMTNILSYIKLTCNASIKNENLVCDRLMVITLLY